MTDARPEEQAIFRAESTPKDTGRGLGSLFGGNLPAVVLRHAAKRLKIVAIVAIGLYTVGLIMVRLVLPATKVQVDTLQNPAFVPNAIIAISLSIGILILSRLNSDRPRLLLDIGLLYGIALATLASISTHWIEIITIGKHGISWTAVWMLIYLMIVPSTPGRTLVAALVGVSTEFIGFGVAISRGLPAPPTPELLLSMTPNYLIGLVAVVPSLIMNQMGRQVRRAQELGSYHLEKMLGRGGMGEVWLARHRMLARPAAIKLIRPEVLSAGSNDAAQTAVHRFEREAQATSLLRSPHTVELYDFGTTLDGSFYYVMELLDGIDLESLVQRFGPVPSERVVHILRQACHSLADAHNDGLIHRDIKPANIYTCRMGIDLDFIKVLDFGLVKSEKHTEREPTVILTAENAAAGTPAFMSPEQATGEQEVDGRSDLYALGCVGYWLLTARLPFEGDNPVKVIVQHVREQPIPPRERIQSEIDPELEALVLRCMAKTPEERPRDAASLADELGRCRIAGAWTPQQAQQWWEANLPATENGKETRHPGRELDQPGPKTILQIQQED